MRSPPSFEDKKAKKVPLKCVVQHIRITSKKDQSEKIKLNPIFLFPVVDPSHPYRFLLQDIYRVDLFVRADL